MGFKCPVDDCLWTTNRYPRSAGMKHVQTHLWDDHPEQYQAYLNAKAAERDDRSLLKRLLYGSDVDINDF